MVEDYLSVQEKGGWGFIYTKWEWKTLLGLIFSSAFLIVSLEFQPIIKSFKISFSLEKHV